MTQTIDYDDLRPWHKRIARKARQLIDNLTHRVRGARNWKQALIGWCIIIGLPTIIVGPFLLHIAYCLMAERAIMLAILILGLILPPIGWFHGLTIFLSWIF